MGYLHSVQLRNGDYVSSPRFANCGFRASSNGVGDVLEPVLLSSDIVRSLLF